MGTTRNDIYPYKEKSAPHQAVLMFGVHNAPQIVVMEYKYQTFLHNYY